MFAFYQEMPGVTMSQQAALDRYISDDALVGCVVHVAAEYADGVRMIDVWSDEAAYRAFQTEHLWPALDRLAAEDASAGQAAPNVGAFSVVEIDGPSRSGPISASSTSRGSAG